MEHQWLHRPFRSELRNNCGLLEFSAHSLWMFAAQLQAWGSSFRDQEGRASCGFPLASIPLAKSNTGSATRGISEKSEEKAGAVSGAVVWVGYFVLEMTYSLLKAVVVEGIISSSPLGVTLCVMEKWDWVGWVSKTCPFFWRVWQFGGTSWSPALFSSVVTSGCLWADPGFLKSHSIFRICLGDGFNLTTGSASGFNSCCITAQIWPVLDWILDLWAKHFLFCRQIKQGICCQCDMGQEQL